MNNATILPDHIHRKLSSKTVCVTAALTSLGIPVTAFHSTSTRKNTFAYENVIRRQGFALRSRRSSVPKKVTVGGVRQHLSKLDDPAGTRYMIYTRGATSAHVLILDQQGKTIVDTAPRKRDRRPVVRLHAIWPKA